MKKSLKKTIVIMGPTASGKSDLAIALAKKYDGEIISADSRQVYKGMDIGSGKVTKREQKNTRHWLLDVASPKRNYNVTHFVRDAKNAMQNIQSRDRTPIICGGTGFWAQTLIEENSFPQVKPNASLRKKLEKISTEMLFKKLKKADSRRAKNIDPKNRVRLIRALEIVSQLGKVPNPQKNKIDNEKYIIIALNPEKEILHKNIETRLEKRLKKGMISEIKKLRNEGLSWKKMESFGLEYRFVSLFLQKKITRSEMIEKLNFEIRHYAKRQVTWLKRFEKMGARIHWISDPKQALSIIQHSI